MKKWHEAALGLIVALLVGLAVACKPPPSVKVGPPTSPPTTLSPPCNLPDITEPCGHAPHRIYPTNIGEERVYVFDQCAVVYIEGPRRLYNPANICHIYLRSTT